MFFTKKNGNWYFGMRYTDGKGRSRQVLRLGGPTKQDAKKAGNIYLVSHMDTIGRWHEPEKMLFSVYWEIFCREYVEQELRPATIRTYRSVGRTHLLPALGDWPLADFTPRNIRNYIYGLAETMSKGTLSILLSVLKSSMKYCTYTCQFLPTNPAAGVSLPKRFEKLPKPTHVFDADEIRKIFDRFRPEHDYHMPIALAYYTGMRLGECLALKWDDVDMAAKEIYVHTTMFDHHGCGEVQDMPKTKSSVRYIPYGEKLQQELLAARALQKERLAAAGGFWQGEGFVCCRDTGKYLTSDSMRFFTQWCRDALGAGSFHSLRHTHATMLLEDGGESLEMVSKRLGHSSVVITAKVYSHVMQGRKDKLRSVLDKVF